MRDFRAWFRAVRRKLWRVRFWAEAVLAIRSIQLTTVARIQPRGDGPRGDEARIGRSAFYGAAYCKSRASTLIRGNRLAAVKRGLALLDKCGHPLALIRCPEQR